MYNRGGDQKLVKYGWRRDGDQKVVGWSKDGDQKLVGYGLSRDGGPKMVEKWLGRDVFNRTIIR